MMNIECFLNGLKVNPVNLPELTLSLNFDKDSPESFASTNSWRFVKKDADLIASLIADGLTGGFGIFQSPLFEIKISDGSTTNTFKQYLELNSESAKYGEQGVGIVELPSKQYSDIDWLSDIADSFTFEYLASIGTITTSDYIAVPYVLLDELDRGWYKDVFITLFGITFTTLAIYEQIMMISATVAEIGGIFNAGGAALKLPFMIAYYITLVITLINLMQDLLDLIIQKVKYHKGMFYKTLMEKACAHLNLTFASSILVDDAIWKELFHLPRKIVQPADFADDRIRGFLTPDNSQNGFYDGTFRQLIEELKQAFNGKVIFENNGSVLRFERADYVVGNSVYVLPDMRIDFKGYNADECVSNYVVEFLTDSGDNNTLREYAGTIAQAILEPQTYSDKKLVQLRNLKRVTIPCALGKKKESLTKLEEIVSDGLNLIDAAINTAVAVGNAVIDAINFVLGVIDVLGDILDFFGIDNNLEAPQIDPIPQSTLSDILNDRIDMLVLQNDTVLIPKMILLGVGNIDRNNKVRSWNSTYLNARYLYENFHLVNSFYPNGFMSQGNQWVRYEIEKCKFTYNDFILVNNNSRVFDHEGNICKIESLEWNPWDCTASIKFRRNKLYTLNLIHTINEGQGY